MWSEKHNLDACKNCHTNDRPHEANGLCKRCYNKEQRKKLLPLDKELRKRAIRDYMRQRRQEDPEELNQRAKAWREANPHEWRAIRLRRRARQEGVNGDATGEQIAARIEYYGERCYLCGEPYEGIDHVIPMSRGGPNYPANIRPVCNSCNSSKNRRTLAEYEEGISIPNTITAERFV